MEVNQKASGLAKVRFHDGRHTALTRLAEAGQPDWVIQAQMGHVSPAMMKTYSHVRRLALDSAAKALEPKQPEPEVTSQATSQSAALDAEITQLASEFGSSGWIRTSNPPVNSRTVVPAEFLLIGNTCLTHLRNSRLFS